MIKARLINRVVDDKTQMIESTFEVTVQYTTTAEEQFKETFDLDMDESIQRLIEEMI